MRCPWFGVSLVLSFVLATPPIQVRAAQSDSTADMVKPQRQSSSGASRAPGRQTGDDPKVLEIAPQPGNVPAEPNAATDNAERAFKPSQDTASTDRSDTASNREDEGRQPYLGLTLEPTTECLMGMEEHGFEVVELAPDSPGIAAGLHPRKAGTRLGDLKVFASLLAGPVALFTIPRIRRSGDLGVPGDLIVGINGYRVRNEQQVEQLLAPLRPGDTAYLTVIRPVEGGGHQTLRIKLHIDKLCDRPKSVQTHF